MVQLVVEIPLGMTLRPIKSPEEIFGSRPRRWSAPGDKAEIAIDARRWAAVRRSNHWSMALHPSQIRKTFERGTQLCQIAVPGGGPAMRGGLRP